MIDKIKILKKGGVGIIPTDTLYGIVASAFSKSAVERIYKIKGRNKNKPFIILISSIDDLKKFGISNSLILKHSSIFKKVWPGKVSIILKVKLEKFKYLHRGFKTLAFRIPKNNFLQKILKKSGPLVAPSANFEGKKPASNITEAKLYFRKNVDFYIAGRKLEGKPSSLIALTKDGIKILRGDLKLGK